MNFVRVLLAVVVCQSVPGLEQLATHNTGVRQVHMDLCMTFCFALLVKHFATSETLVCSTCTSSNQGLDNSVEI